MNTESKHTGANEDILLSVSMITYNHEKYIAQALDSVLMQKVDFKYEIVIGEDCSTDGTRAILLEYQNKYPGIFNLILHPENVGAIRNAQAVDKACRGKYNAALEGDDYWTDPNKLQIQVDEMRKYPDCQMSFHPALEIWEDNSRKNEITSRRAKGNKLFTTSEVIKGGGGFCPTASLMFKKEVLDNLPQWCYEAPIGDYYVQILGSLSGGALYIDRPMSVYRRNAPDSWSISNKNTATRKKFYQDTLITFDELDHYLNNEFHDEINIVRSEVCLKLAILYLKENKFKKFNESIHQSYLFSNKKSIKLYTCFYLRKFPRLLQEIGKLYSFIRRRS